MKAVGYATAEEAEAAFQAELQLTPHSGGTPRGSYFLDLVLNDLEERYGPEVVYHGGLKVSTTLDPQQQAWAIESLQNGLIKLDRLMGIYRQRQPADSPAGGTGGHRMQLRRHQSSCGRKSLFGNGI
jgi:penicillin-binding protein 1A